MSFDFSNFPSSSDPFSSSSSSSSSSSCELSPHDRFLSTVLTSFIGSIVTGISGGFFIAFCTAWICWFATMRILVVGFWFNWQAFSGNNLEGGVVLLKKIPLFNRSKRIQNMENPLVRKTEYTPVTAPPAYEEVLQMGDREQHIGEASQWKPYQPISSSVDSTESGLPSKTSNQPAKSRRLFLGFESGPPTILGWAGWLYATLYFPIVQILWLASNWTGSPSAGTVKLVRAIGVAVTALPLTMDTKARYAVMLEKRWGRWANRVFTHIHAFSTLVLGIVSAIMLIVAVVQMPIPVFFVPIYVIFSTIWMLGSFVLFPPFDGGMPPNSIATFLAGLAMGCFGGAFTSAPAFASMNMAPTSPGTSLGEYLKCEGVSVLDKFVAIFP